MKLAVLVSATLVSASALAAEVTTSFLDHSNAGLIDEATAFAVMKETIPAKV